MNHRNIDHSLTGNGKPFVVFTEAAIPAEPAKGAFNDPSPRQDYETFNTNRSQYGLQDPAASRVNPLDQLTCIPTIGPDELQTRQGVANLLQNQLRPITILDVCGMNDDGQNQPEGVYQQVPFSAEYF